MKSPRPLLRRAAWLACALAGSACVEGGSGPAGEASADTGVDAAPIGPLPRCSTPVFEGGFSAVSPPRGDSVSPAFDDVSEAVGLPVMYAHTASWGDLNGDGAPELVVPGYWRDAQRRVPDLYGAHAFALCADGTEPIDLAARTDSVLEDAPNASFVADLDGDGLADIVTPRGNSIRVWYGEPDGRYPEVVAWRRTWRTTFRGAYGVMALDFDRDGRLELLGADLIRTDPWLRSIGREWVAMSDERDGFYADTFGENYQHGFFAGPLGEDRFWVGNHGPMDTLLDMSDPWAPEPLATELGSVATMGFDVWHADDAAGSYVVTTDTGRLPMFLVRGDTVSDESHRLSASASYNTWGVVFEDFDNDGLPDLAYAAGNEEMAPELVAQIDTTFDNRLVLLRGRWIGDEPVWEDASASAGDAFGGPPWVNLIGLAAADFDFDGCVDLVAAPQQRWSARPPLPLYEAPIRLLRNRCDYPGHWLGVLLADDPGAVATLLLRDEAGRSIRRIREVRATSSFSARGYHPQLHFGLGEIDRVDGLEVVCRDGRVHSLGPDQIVIDRYTDLRHVCARPPAGAAPTTPDEPGGAALPGSP